MSPRRRNRAGPTTYWKIVTTSILLRLGALSCGLLTAAALTAPAYAQSADLPPPMRHQTDGNGVDLTRATHMVNVTDIAIGPQGRGGLAYVRQLERDASRNLYDMGVFVLNFDWTATFGLQTYAFTLSGGTYTSTDGSGATLTFGGGAYALTLPDGTAVTYANTTPAFGDNLRRARATAVAYPTGEQISLAWVSTTYCSIENVGGSSTLNRQQLQIIGTYIDELPNTPLNQRVRAAWRNRFGS